MNIILPFVDSYIRNIESFNIKKTALAKARSLFALGALSTLIFNNSITLFNPTNIPNPGYETFHIYKYSIFYLLSNHLIIAKSISIIILMSVIIGIYPRYTCILHWWVSFSIVASSFIIEGGDQITQIITFLLIPICLNDNRSNHWDVYTTKNSFDAISFFALLLIKVQIALLYFDSTISKLNCEDWVNGTALYYWLTDPNFGVNEFFEMLLRPFITNDKILPFLTWSILLFEFLLFLCLFSFKKYHNVILKFGIFFHFAIFIFLGLFSFFLAMSGCLFLYLSNFKNNNYD